MSLWKNKKLTWDGELLAGSLGGLSRAEAMLFCFLREPKYTEVNLYSFISFSRYYNFVCREQNNKKNLDHTIFFINNFIL